jgi:hypothetical protein
MATTNRHFFIRHGRTPIEIDLDRPDDLGGDVSLTFWTRVLRFIEADIQGITFYVVWATQPVRTLPSYGDDVVVLLLMDESCELPAYHHKVRMVFKTLGLWPYISLTPRGKSLGHLAKYCRDVIIWASRLALVTVGSSTLPSPQRLMAVPLGYGRQIDLPIKPFDDRRHLVSFHGSIRQRDYAAMSIRSFLKPPKETARTAMADALTRMADRMPDLVYFFDTGSFDVGFASDGREFSEVMAETRICLAPRGSCVETFRLFEAMRQGCIVITDRLPPYRFYANCPAILIDDWRDLERVVDSLIAEPDRMRQLHRAALRWWDTTACERAVARAIATQLQESYQASEPTLIEREAAE